MFAAVRYCDYHYCCLRLERIVRATRIQSQLCIYFYVILYVCECVWCTCSSERTDKRDLHPIFFLIGGPTQRVILTRRFPLHCSVDRSADTNPRSRRMCRNTLNSAFPIAHRIWYYYYNIIILILFEIFWLTSRLRVEHIVNNKYKYSYTYLRIVYLMYITHIVGTSHQVVGNLYLHLYTT